LYAKTNESRELAEALKDRSQLTSQLTRAIIIDRKANTATAKQGRTTTLQSTKWQALEVERQTTRLALNIRAEMPVLG
jgi:hypothetical protein